MRRLLIVLPWLALGLAAMQLYNAYPGFPERWAIHWNAAGQANGFTDKTPMGAAFPLLMGAAMALLMEVIALWTGAMRNSTLPGQWPQRLAQATQSFVRMTSVCTSFFFGYLALSLPHGPPSLWAVLLMVAGCIAYPVLSTFKLYDEMRQEGALPPGYRGFYYSNADDPRLWVPKLGGAGITINFGHPQAWMWMLLILALPACALITGLLVILKQQ